MDRDNVADLAALAWSLKARVEAAKAQIDRAISAYDEAIRLDSKRAIFLIERGNAWNSKGDFARALSDYDSAIKLDPENREGYAVPGWIAKASVHARNNELQPAINDYDEAIKLAPNQAGLYIDRAAFLSRLGENARALDDYDKAIELAPKSAQALNARGNHFRSLSDYSRALKDYDSAAGLQEGYLPTYGNRALARFYAGEFSKSADDFKRVVDEQANAYSMLMLWAARARAGRKDATGELAKTVSKLRPGEWPYPIAELYLGRKALQAVETAATKPEKKCELQFHAGEFHLSRGARAPATKAFQAAVDTCPKNFVEYRGALEELKRLK